MRKQFLHLALVATVGMTAVANAASKAETGLLGIKLYDSGLKVLGMFGNPDEIQAVNIGGGATFGGGGAGAGAPRGGGGFPGGGGAPGGRAGGGGGGGAAAGAENSINPFDFGDTIIRQGAPAGIPGRGGPPSAGGGGGGPQGPPGGFPGGPPGGFPGSGAPGGGAPSRGGGAPAAAGAGDRVTVTRWVYNKRASKYAFIVDRQGRIVQIEAIGLKDSNVKTATKLSFGATFKTLIKTYGNPDGYEISGDNILVKYLTRKKIAFKMSRLGAKQPQVVTGIVVAAGKS